MIEDLVPHTVATAETPDDSPHCVLFPDEEAVIAAAVDKRRREFTTARWCARQALRQLGHPAAAVLPGIRGAPVWPDGIVGSITHCNGYRAAAVAWASAVATLGIDAEPNEPLPAGVLNSVALDQELPWLADLQRAVPEVRWDRLLFCAKESVYKAWSPLTRRWLDFHDVEVTVDPDAGVFHAVLSVPAHIPRNGRPLNSFSGRWLVSKGLVVTAIAVPGDNPGRGPVGTGSA